MNKMNKKNLAMWPADLCAVFAVIGAALGTKPLMPEILESISNDLGNTLPGHQVKITYHSGTSSRQRGRYQILITGPRTKGGWNFKVGELELLSKLAAQNI
jgi:hypothetical protein